MKLSQIIRNVFNKFNIDIIRLRNSPDKTMLGLIGYEIDCILDVGANEGQFAKKISEIFPAAIVYCFEPLKAPFVNLNIWGDTQNSRIKCFNIGLGETCGFAQMHFHENHSPSSSLLSSTAHGHQLYPQTIVECPEVVRVETLDSLVENSLVELGANVLLKLDVQGFEDRVLRGATGLLNRVSACLLEVCLDPLYQGQACFLDLVKLLDKANFIYAGNVFQSYGDDGHVIYIDALFIKQKTD